MHEVELVLFLVDQGGLGLAGIQAPELVGPLGDGVLGDVDETGTIPGRGRAGIGFAEPDQFGTIGVVEAGSGGGGEAVCLTCGIARHQGLHLPIPEWSGLITALACPYNPAHLNRGAVYRFNVNHIVEPDDPYEMFPTEYFEIDGATQRKLPQ